MPIALYIKHASSPIPAEKAKQEKTKPRRRDRKGYPKHKEMVAGFRRSLSLPGLSPSASPARCRLRGDAPAPHHARSASLPCRSHPALSLLLDEIRSLRSSADLGSPASAAGLERVDRLLAALDDLLRLPQAQEPLRRRPAWADRLLDGFLRLADAQGSFRAAAIALAQHAAEARAAARRREPVRLASAARCHRRAEKELAGLASAIKDLARCPPSAPGQCADAAAEAEVAGIVAEAVAATAASMSAVFLAIASAAAAAAASSARDSWREWALKKASPSRKREVGEAELEAMAKLEELAEGVEGLEAGSERVYRSLVNIRVSLLNILTPSL